MDTNLIREKIYEIRGQKIMLDFDLAELYGVETEEWDALKYSSQIVMSSKKNRGSEKAVRMSIAVVRRD